MNRSLPIMLAVVASLGVTPRLSASDFLGKDVKSWINELKSGRSPQSRQSAAFALGKLGFGGSAAVGHLVDALKDPDSGLRETAAFALGEIAFSLGDVSGSAWQDCEAALVKLLKAPEPLVRRSAAYAIGCFGPRAGSAKSSLLAALTDDSALVRQNAAWAMGRLGTEAGADGVAQLNKLLVQNDDKSDAVVRRDAAAALGDIGKPTARGSVHALAECCRRDQDELVRRAALDSLVSLAGPEDREAIPALVTLLKHDDPEIARSAAFALGNIGGKDTAPALPVLRKALREDNAEMKSLAAAAIAGLGAEAAPAVPDLALALADATPTVRRNAAVALSRVGHDAAPAVQALSRAIGPQENNAEVRVFAAEALSKIGPSMEKVMPNILAALRDDKNQDVRLRTVWALLNVPDLKKNRADAVLAEVMHETGADSLWVRFEGARCLAIHLGPETPSMALDVLLEYLKDTRGRVYNQTDARVGGGKEGQSGSSNVSPNLGNDARFLAAMALARIGPKAKRPDIIEALKELEKSGDQRCREEAANALTALQRR